MRSVYFNKKKSKFILELANLNASIDLQRHLRHNCPHSSAKLRSEIGRCPKPSH